MSKHQAKQPDTAAMPDGMAKDAELDDAQLNDVSGGFVAGYPTEKVTHATTHSLHVRKAGGNQSE